MRWSKEHSGDSGCKACARLVRHRFSRRRPCDSQQPSAATSLQPVLSARPTMQAREWVLLQGMFGIGVALAIEVAAF
jgi:hypothetical protein